MGKRLKILLALLLVVVILVVLLNVNMETSNPLEWLDSIGLPEVKDCKYVRVSGGNWAGKFRMNDISENAFLLEEDEDSFTVLTQNLLTKTLKKGVPDSSFYPEAYYVEINIQEFAEEYLDKLQDPNLESSFMAFGNTVPQERLEANVLAWGCHQKGYDDLANELLLQILYIRKWSETSNGSGEVSIIKRLESDIGHILTWQAVLDFDDLSVSREEILEKIRFIRKNYPRVEHRATIDEGIKILRQMVAEDKKHEKENRPAVESLSKAEQIEELIYQLRDQNGHQYSQPGRPDIFLDPRGEESPAEQLAGMGFEAVDQLIGVLDNTNFTRTVGYFRNYAYTHEVMRVGDCALKILERIAGRQFYSYTYTDYLTSSEETDAIHREVQVWWNDIQEKGEMVVLIEATEKGNIHSPAQGQRLLEKYPEFALEPIVKGARAATENWEHTRLVKLAGEVEGDGPIPFLMEELLEGKWIDARVEAARALHKRGRAEAVDMMIELWEQEPSVANFLVESRNIEAMKAIGKNISHQNIYTRMETIYLLQKEIVNIVRPETDIDNVKAILDSMEDVLAACLEDTEAQEGVTETWYGKLYEDPRICDKAGHALWKCWPEKYTFNFVADFEERERQRLECYKVWQESRLIRN
ncbi:MAG: hypothetical protein GY869_01595 [Planctomycetes bacterium]|nr:hypothetical protein [Planctomycetota bacterium]